jgi:hypothetical protein
VRTKAGKKDPKSDARNHTPMLSMDFCLVLTVVLERVCGYVVTGTSRQATGGSITQKGTHNIPRFSPLSWVKALLPALVFFLICGDNTGDRLQYHGVLDELG